MTKNPLSERSLRRAVKSRKAKKGMPKVSLELDLFYKKKVNTGQIKIEKSHELKRKNKIEGYNNRISIPNFQLGEHNFPPDIEAKGVKLLRKKFKGDEDKDLVGLTPDHLPLNVLPKKLEKRFVRPALLNYKKLFPRTKDEHDATTIFGADNRYLFNDTAFPWCTVGRVDTPGGYGSGVMVGPRHLLTCSHVIQWLSGNRTGWIRFRPSYFDGSAPFGSAWGVLTYYKVKVTGPTISSHEGKYDYVCVVLDRRMGNWTGWMGSRTYSDSWDGNGYWRHIGYPGDIGGGQRPSFQAGIALDGSFWDPASHQRIYHWGDIWPGQSGGPFFAWWSGESWPRVVSVQSGHTSERNSSSGGSDMVDLIIRARNEHP